MRSCRWRDCSPTPVVTKMVRTAAGRLDYATSNVPGYPIPMFISGAKVLNSVAFGPVAGTAANITALSYCNNFQVTLFIDPRAIEDPAGFASHLSDVFDDSPGSPMSPARR